MTMFDDREKTFEKSFEHDQELQFRVHARRNKMLGLWAASHMGLKGRDADSYARGILEAGIERGNDETVMKKLADDLSAKGVDISQHRLKKKMDELNDIAYRQVMMEPLPGTL